MKNDEKVNILVVDDLEEKLLVYETILEGLGQNVVAARSGREALRHLLEKDFAVILLDVHMPDMDGLETAAMIRSRRQTAQTAQTTQASPGGPCCLRAAVARHPLRMRGPCRAV